MLFQIVRYGDPVLDAWADPITKFGSQDLTYLVDSMFDTMYAAMGIGLAAPQVGVSKQVAVIDLSSGQDPTQRIVLINPSIQIAEGKQVGEEGCLSIPGFLAQIIRYDEVVVEAKDIYGKSFMKTGKGLLARAIQHEVDHLHGILYLFHMSPLRRDSVLGGYRAAQKKLANEGHE